MTGSIPGKTLTATASESRSATLRSATIGVTMSRASGVTRRRVASAWRVSVRSVRLRIVTLAMLAIAVSGIGVSNAPAIDFVCG